eukprot:scaffold5986_cov128-Isochrysis_galbana.AAC.6
MDWLGGGDGDATMTGVLGRIRPPSDRVPTDGIRSASAVARRRQSLIVVKVLEGSGVGGPDLEANRKRCLEYKLRQQYK